MITWTIEVELGEADPNRFPVTDHIASLGLALEAAGVQHSIRVRRDRTIIRPGTPGEPQPTTTERNEHACSTMEPDH